MSNFMLFDTDLRTRGIQILYRTNPVCLRFNDDKGGWTLASGRRHYCIGLGWIDSRKHSTLQTLAGPIDVIKQMLMLKNKI